MKNGNYTVTEDIYIPDQGTGHVRISANTRIIVSGSTAVAASYIRFPSKLLDTVQHYLIKEV